MYNDWIQEKYFCKDSEIAGKGVPEAWMKIT